MRRKTMLPQKETAILQNGFYITQQPSKTYHMDFKKEVSMGKTDGLEALRQAVFLILHIERYEHLIYSWRYGVELKDLFGKQITYVKAVLPTRIKEALLMDDRIEDVHSFEITNQKNTVFVKFTVVTSYGTFSQEVSYDF